MDWILLSLLAGLCSLFITVLLGMLSRTLGMQSVAQWVKSEYAQVAATFLIIFLAAFIYFIGTQIADAIVLQMATAMGNKPLTEAMQTAAAQVPGELPFEVAKSYIMKPVVYCETVIYKAIFWLNWFIEPLSTLHLGVSHIDSKTGGYAFNWITSTFRYLAISILYLSLFHYIQYYLLIFSQYTMLPIFLPVGLILRAFPLTRGAGGLIVAFSLGFAFVFPITYLLLIAMLSTVSDTWCDEVSSSSPKGEGVAEEYDFTNRGSVMQALFEAKSKKSQIDKFADDTLGILSVMYIEALMFPLVSLIVTFTFIRQTSSLFGADLAEIGRGIIKII